MNENSNEKSKLNFLKVPSNIPFDMIVEYKFKNKNKPTINQLDLTQEALNSFFKTISINNPDNKSDILHTTNLSLTIDGRKSIYEFFYFFDSKELFAIDLKDSKLVYTLILS